MANLKITTTNKELFDTIRDLKKLSNSTNKKLYKVVADKLNNTAKNKISVNLYKLEKLVKSGETIVVPGKVLGNGNLSKKITIIAYDFSDNAINKLEAAKIKYVTLKDFVKKPLNTDLRIIT